jgi:hypothetical protein
MGCVTDCSCESKVCFNHKPLSEYIIRSYDHTAADPSLSYMDYDKWQRDKHTADTDGHGIQTYYWYRLLKIKQTNIYINFCWNKSQKTKGLKYLWRLYKCLHKLTFLIF